jgi:hypothetical protein
MRFALGLTLVGWMCLPATAQTPPFNAATGQVVDWPDTWSGKVTRMVSGDFTGDLYRDLALLDGSQLVLAFGPSTFSVRSPLESGVTDFCAVPKSAGVDGLVAVDSSGLRKIWIDYTLDEDHVQSVQISGTGAWVDAFSLQSVPGVGNNSQKVVALNETGTKVLLLSSPWLSPSTDEITSLGGVGLALAVLDWDGDENNSSEIALLHQQGLTIYDPWTLDEVDTVSLPGSQLTGGTLVAFKQAGSDADRLAVLLKTSSANQLWIVDDPGDPMTLSAANPYALAAGNVSGNETDEILVAHRGTAGPLLYECTGTGGSCSLGSSGSLSIGIADLSEQESLPVLADFTADGDVDIAWFFEEDAVLHLAENLSEDHLAFLIQVQVDESRAHLDVEDSGPDLGALRVKFNQPSETAFTPNKILVEQWYQDIPDAVQPLGQQHFLVSYPEDWSTRHTLFLWPTGVNMDGVLHLTVRPVEQSGNNIVKAGPASVVSVALTEGGCDYLTGFLDPLPLVDILIIPTQITPPPVPPSGLPSLPHGQFIPNTPDNAGGGNPAKPPPGDTIPPKAPKTLIPS